ncbi:hypothetical protein M422DRAFT_269962 [Sphaerobolus stellatus SS14]|uniref:Uncharacterized protein n=1 Tax=Sphaerobolus stellatus (strain SS14) TaxID=990650 RepID=A0A0C9UU63_SPHS4|nr:hypothetical protein M422DRAFT_269962 [Sphaerobolus stellatus SS14]
MTTTIRINLNDEAKKGAVVQVTVPPHAKDTTDIIVMFGDGKDTSDKATRVVTPEKKTVTTSVTASSSVVFPILPFNVPDLESIVDTSGVSTLTAEPQTSLSVSPTHHHYSSSSIAAPLILKRSASEANLDEQPLEAQKVKRKLVRRATGPAEDQKLFPFLE